MSYTQEDIIRIAREAGITGMLTDVVCEWKNIVRFAELVTAAERTSLQESSEDLQSQQDREIGKKWREDSRLEEWFPLTHEEHCRLQVEVAQLRGRLARSGVELRRAVRDEREACAKVCHDIQMGAYSHQSDDYFDGKNDGARRCWQDIRARNHIADVNKMVPGLALDSGEFVPAEKMTDWAAA